MALPAAIAALIETFAANEADYTAAEFKEAQVRQQFIDPFFAALGWDVANTAGYAEAYKEVMHEDALKIGGETKAPDYPSLNFVCHNRSSLANSPYPSGFFLLTA